MPSLKKLGVALVLSISAVFLLTRFTKLSNHEPAVDSTLLEIKAQFPGKVANRISIPAQGSNEESRTEFYDSDNVTLLAREIVYKNGVTSYFYFRKNKIAERMEEFYPADNGSKTRALKTKVIYEEDGALFASHQSWRPDKTLIKNGSRQNNGTYRTITYFEDGVTIERVQNFTRKREMTDETVHRKDGVISRVTLITKNREREVTLFRPDAASEIVHMTMTISRSQYNGVKGQLFSEDGSKVVSHFELRSYQSEFTYLDADEKPHLMVRFERTVAGHLTIKTIVQDAQVKLSQVYLRRDGSEHGCGGSYALNSVDEFAADNSAIGMRPFRRIYLAEDEVTIKSVTIPDQTFSFMGKGTLYELYPSGFVAKKKVFSSPNTISSVTDYADKQYREPAAEVTDRSIFKRPDFQCPSPLPVWNQDKSSWIID